MTFSNFIHMGGYGIYVWPAYGCTAIVLGWQWFAAWRQWKHTEIATAASQPREDDINITQSREGETNS